MGKVNVDGGDVLLTRDVEAPVSLYHCPVHGAQDDCLMVYAAALCLVCGRTMAMKEKHNA